MQFRAVTANTDLSAKDWLYIRDVECPVCSALFHLWAPIIEGEQTEIQFHTDWLSQHLMNICPNHAQDLRTPDPTAERSRQYWLEEARASAILEAEDAGLRGTDRERFIRERTDIHYTELLRRRVG
jgi:hypothetical protein